MTEQLKRAFELAQTLTDTTQNILAAIILEAIEELEWDNIIGKNGVQQKLLDLANDAWKEHEAGKTTPGGFAAQSF